MSDSRDRPVPSGRRPSPPAGRAEVEAFLEAARRTAPVAAGAGGRLMFALDATFSRQPAWDMAQSLQAGMFEEAARLGGLMVKLVYFRGHDECAASRWVADGAVLSRLMGRIDCRGGATQMARVLRHAVAERRAGPLRALVYIGDAMEEEPGAVLEPAGELALLGVPVFLFQEGHDPMAAAVFGQIARLTRGAHVGFGRGSAAELGRLLRAVAAFASGGRDALSALARTGDPAARALLGPASGP